MPTPFMCLNRGKKSSQASLICDWGRQKKLQADKLLFICVLHGIAVSHQKIVQKRIK
jgi:hypothetical protein